MAQWQPERVGKTFTIYYDLQHPQDAHSNEYFNLLTGIIIFTVLAIHWLLTALWQALIPRRQAKRQQRLEGLDSIMGPVHHFEPVGQPVDENDSNRYIYRVACLGQDSSDGRQYFLCSGPQVIKSDELVAQGQAMVKVHPEDPQNISVDLGPVPALDHPSPYFTKRFDAIAAMPLNIRLVILPAGLALMTGSLFTTNIGVLLLLNFLGGIFSHIGGMMLYERFSGIYRPWFYHKYGRKYGESYPV